MPDRFDEILEEMRRDRAEQAAHWDKWGARFDRQQEQIDENLRFLGELNRRNEIVMRQVVRESRESRREIRESIKEGRKRTAEISARMERNSEDAKAHTRAIFALIDRIERGGGPALAG